MFIYSALPIVVTTGGSVGSGGKVVSTAGVVGVGIGGMVVDVVDAKILQVLYVLGKHIYTQQISNTRTNSGYLL